jgi:hypothetical protein
MPLLAPTRQDALARGARDTNKGGAVVACLAASRFRPLTAGRGPWALAKPIATRGSEGDRGRPPWASSDREAQHPSNPLRRSVRSSQTAYRRSLGRRSSRAVADPVGLSGESGTNSIVRKVAPSALRESNVAAACHVMAAEQASRDVQLSASCAGHETLLDHALQRSPPCNGPFARFWVAPREPAGSWFREVLAPERSRLAFEPVASCTRPKGDGRAGFRPEQVQPRVPPLPATRQSRGALRVAIPGNDPQPAKAPHPLDQPGDRLSGRGDTGSQSRLQTEVIVKRHARQALPDSHGEEQGALVFRWTCVDPGQARDAEAARQRGEQA